MRTLAFSMILFVLAGCAVGPDYSRPDLQVPTGFGWRCRMGRRESLPICPGGICCKTRNCVASFASPWRRTTGICSGRWRPLQNSSRACSSQQWSLPEGGCHGQCAGVWSQGELSLSRLPQSVQLPPGQICLGSWISGGVRRSNEAARAIYSRGKTRDDVRSCSSW